MVTDLLRKKCIRELGQTEQGFFSRVFLVPKRSGGFRLVIDLSQLNKYIATTTFTMDTLAKVKAVAEKGMWATSIDLSDAYHHIPMAEVAHKYLCFEVNGKRYCFLVLPFGLGTAPWAFTEVVKQLKIWSSAHLLVLFQYLDDWLQLHRSRTRAAHWAQELVKLCAKLGLLVNFAKSELIPVRKIVFLGERLDFTVGKAFPTEDRKVAVTKVIDRALTQGGLPFPEAESLLGLLSATYATFPLGRLHLRTLQRQVIIQIRRGRISRAWIALTPMMRTDLQWWMIPSRWARGIPFRPPAFTETVFTDASTKGWGVVFRDQSWQGQWQRQTQHINWLELRAVLIALQLLQFQLQGKVVRCLIDNTTAVAYLKNQGGTRSQSLTKLAGRIHRLAHEKQITLMPQHIAGQLNVLADLASRVNQVIPSEWTVSDRLFQWIETQSPWGPLEIDLFANEWTKKVKVYVSPCPDPNAWAIDALSCQMPTCPAYAYPPACLLTQFLQRLKRTPRFRVALLASYNPQAKATNLLLSLPVRKEVEIPLALRQFHQPHWDYTLPNPEQLDLKVAFLEKSS